MQGAYEAKGLINFRFGIIHRFSYPENLKLSEGDADIGSIIRLWSPLREDKDSGFQIRMPFDLSSAEELIQKREQAGFTIEKEFLVDGFLATQLRGTNTPNASIAPRMTTRVVV